MKLTKKLEAEIRKLYEVYWNSYINGDMETYASLLDEEFKFIGSTEAEPLLNKKDSIKLLDAVKEQMAGKAEFRNRNIKVELVDELILVSELCDGYILIGTEWNFYSRFRLSSLLKKKRNKWKFIHQHVSMPDSKAQEGEAYGLEQIRTENIQLRDAVKRRTVELENKNRELEIEASLEKVRAVAMSMRKADDLMLISEIIYKQIIALGFMNVRNVQIAIDNDEKQLYNGVEYSEYYQNRLVEVPYDSSPMFREIVNELKRSNNAFYQKEIRGKEFKAWRTWRMNIDAKNHPDIATATSMCFYLHSVGAGMLGISTFNAITNDQLEILKRFRNVFELSYSRYIDIEKAEAQAREAQIEAALERVRSRSMAMQKSEELKEVIQVVYEQFVHLNIHVEHTGFIIDYKARDDMNIWLADKHAVPFQVTIPYFDCAHWNSFNEAKEKGIDFFANQLFFEEKNKFYQDLFKLIPGVPEETLDYYFSCPGLAISTVLLENVGLYIENFLGIPYTDEENKTLMRFGKVFQQTYTLFNDLKQAEAQAREAQIELGLERVRARAMAMQKSDELSELVDTVFKELTKLDFALNWCIINIIDESTMSNTVWAANPDINKAPESYHMLFEDYPFHHAMMKGWKERNARCVYILEGIEKKVYDEYLFNETEFRRVPAAAQAASRAMGKYVVTFSFSNFGGLQTVGDAPLSDANLDILSRFGKVFDLTYTRFNDLKQAEAQAREAKIQLALERVRARTMAMQKSDELPETSYLLFQQVKELGLTAVQNSIGIVNEDA